MNNKGQIVVSKVGESKTSNQKPPSSHTRHSPIGAEPMLAGGVHFRVWAPQSQRVAVELTEDARFRPDQKDIVELEAKGNGYFSRSLPQARAEMLYKFRTQAGSFPDPASRFQPDGPHGPSQIIDPARFNWTDQDWRGIPRAGQVLYEMHIGTFTREGTYAAAAAELSELKKLGITVIELMPVADFVGRFGWGYDGVNLFAPTRLYGPPDELRAFINQAHRLGLGVILDVVYNHVGPDGNYLKQFAEDYFTDRYTNDWGEAINFDGRNCGPVREFFITNAGYWIEEFHFDGLRLDATQQIYDASPDHILAAIGRAVRAAAKGRSTFIAAENETRNSRLVRAIEKGGLGLDVLWNDDFHHSARVALTGQREAYYSGFKGSPQEFISAVKWGYLYQGQWYAWHRKPRGTLTRGIAPEQFLIFLENHDQVATSLLGSRLHQLTDPGRFRAMTTFFLLAPGTPLLFQGQEFAASAPFLFFADHHPELTQRVAKGRKEFLHQFKSIAQPESEQVLADPGSANTFLRCKLDFSERQTNRSIYELHRALLKLRRQDAVFSRAGLCTVEGAVLGPEAFVLRFLAGSALERLLMVNLGLELKLDSIPEPLIAPVDGCWWRLMFSSEEPRFGGAGTPVVAAEDHWLIPGHAAVVLEPAPLANNEGNLGGQK
jgi:maltooligosyltrehalose trehalohydrolase